MPRPVRLLLKIFLALILGWFLPAAAQGPPGLTVVLGERSSAHLEILEILKKSLGPGTTTGADILVLGSNELSRLPQGGRLIVAVGTQALESLLASEPKTPVLATLLPRASFEKAIAGRQRLQATALYLDQPPGRQLDLLRLAFPERSRIGLLTGPDSRPLGRRFATAATERNLHLDEVFVAREAELYPALERVLANADLFLALPDATVFNTHSIADILLTTYRHKVPLIAFSQAYVRAGALMALFSTPSQIGAQTAEMAQDILARRPLPPPRYPRDFSVTLNAYVARSLGLDLEEESSLRNRLRKLEHLP